MEPVLDIKAEQSAYYHKAEYIDQARFQSSISKPGLWQNQKRGALWPSHLLPPCLSDNISPDTGLKCNLTPRCTGMKST